MLAIIVKYCITETYPEPCQTTKLEHFVKIVSGLQLLTIIEKLSIILV